MPASKPSIVGQRFGMLVCTGMGNITQSKGKKRERMWFFDCDCGEKTELCRWKVEMKKPQQSCGCLNSPTNRAMQKHRGKKPVDVVGQRFGDLIALEQTEIREDNATVWRCLCDCGNAIFMSIRRLHRGFRLNCGDKKHMPGRKKYPPNPRILPLQCSQIIIKYLHLATQPWRTIRMNTAIEDERMARLERAAYILYWRREHGENISDRHEYQYIRKYLYFAKIGFYSRLRRQQLSVRCYTVDDSTDNQIRYPMTKTIGVSPEGNLQVEIVNAKIRKNRRVIYR